MTIESMLEEFGQPKSEKTNDFGDKIFEYEGITFHFMKNPVGTDLFFTGKTELPKRAPKL